MIQLKPMGKDNMRQPFQDARYDSIADFLDAVKLAPLYVGNAKDYAHFMDGGYGDDWLGAGCHTGRDVIKIMSEGWEDGRKRLNELRDTIGNVDLVPVDRRRRPTRGDRGDVLDIHAVYNGRLDIAWRTAKRQTSVAPTRIDLCANMICSGGEHSEVLFWRGAAAAALADILEQAGYMVRLVVNFGGSTGDD